MMPNFYWRVLLSSLRTIRESELSIFKCYGSDKITLALFIKQKYFRNDKENPQFQSVFAIEAMQSGDFENALIVFDKILEKIPEDPVTLTFGDIF